MKLGKSEKQLVDRLRAVLDRYNGRYRELNGARDLGTYLTRDRPREDEELLTEPILADVLERLLGFPADAYFPQLGRGGLKPDFTPHDLVAHRFVLDAKSSTQDLGPDEPQIRRYIDQRQLDYGVLFNLRELRVYRRGQHGHDRGLSFSVQQLWEIANGQALADEDTMASLVEFVDRFSHRALGIAEKIDLIRGARSWSEREGRGDTVEIDLDFLVDRLRDLSRELQADAAAQRESLARTLKMRPGRERSLLRELELIALDLAPGYDLSDLPETVSDYAEGDELPGRVWRQYLLRVSQLALTRIMLYRSWRTSSSWTAISTTAASRGGTTRSSRIFSGCSARLSRTAASATSGSTALTTTTTGTGHATRLLWTSCTRLCPSRSGSSTPMCWEASTSPTSMTSIETGSASSTRRGRSSGSCSTGLDTTVRRRSSGSRATSVRHDGCSTSRPARAASSSKLHAA